MKYLALELVTKTGVENPETILGNVAVTIGGIPVNSNDHVVDTQDAETVDVIIGVDEYEVELTETDELELSPALKEKVAEEVAQAEAAEEEALAETTTEEAEVTE